MHATASRILASALSIACTASFAHAATVRHAGGDVVVEPDVDAPAYQIRLIGPNDFVAELTRLDSEVIAFSPRGKQGWPDGHYRYEIWPIVGVVKRSEAKHDMHMQTAPLRTMSGSFSFDGGKMFASAAAAEPSRFDDPTLKDQVIPDDLIVQGSGCFGFDCVNNESFGTDTIRLKENNLRIKFDDTSASAGFTTTDWQLTANEQQSGGLNKFSIEDITAGTIPFTVLGGAPTNSIYVGSNGFVGFGTSTPGLFLHASKTDTPALRLEQTGGVFTPQTWDILGNDANFAIRDLTGGSQLSFRIRPGAPTSSLDIAGNGNVGFGTASPQTDIHMFGPEPRIRFEHNDGVTTPYTWEIGGAQGFAIRDVTNGNTLPFHIGVAAPASSLSIAPTTGNVGVGVPLATAKLHVAGDGLFTGGINNSTIGAVTAASGRFTTLNASNLLRVQSSTQIYSFGSSSVATSYGVYLKGGTSTPIAYIGSDGGAVISGGTGDNFVIRAQQELVSVAGGAERMRIRTNGNVGIGTSLPTERLHVVGNIFGTGNITINGTLSQGSDRNSKENFEPVDGGDVLDKLAKLDVTRWNYKMDGEEVQHIGPMAQDFYAAFELGEAETKIAPLDTSGVTIVAIQELNRRLIERDAQLAERDAEIAALRERLDRLDAQVAALARIAQPEAKTVSLDAAAETRAKTTGL